MYLYGCILFSGNVVLSMAIIEQKICSNGDVGLTNDKTSFIFWDSKWFPICGHYFWDNNIGASLFCNKLGYNNGIVHRDKNGEKYEVDAFRVGLCNKGDEWENCKGGCNDYKAGGYCGNGNINDRGNGNSGARCEKYHGAKITIACLDGLENRSVSCHGVYECIHKSCDHEQYSENEDWGYYSVTDGNCETCKEKCIIDNACESIECGSTYCRWWKNGKCNEAKKLTVSTNSHILTCLKDPLGNFTEAMEKEKDKHQIETENYIKRKSSLNMKGKGNNSKSWIYATFSIYLVLLAIYIFTSFRKTSRTEDCLSIVGKEIFRFSCYFLAGYMVLTQVLRYTTNEDSSSINYKSFNKDPEDEYPTFSICLLSTPWHKLQHIFDTDLIKKHAISSVEWNKLQKGQAIVRKHWNTKLDFSNFSMIDDDEFGLQFEKFLKAFVNKAITFEAKTETQSRSFLNYKEENKSWPFFLSYVDPDTKCFTRRHEFETGLIRTSDRIWMDLDYLKETKISIHVYLHHTGQLTRSLGKPYFKMYGMELENLNSKITLKLSHVSVLRKRETSKIPCDKELENDDKRFRDEIIKQVGCIPTYWKSLVSNDNRFKTCETSNEMSDIFYYLLNKDEILSLYDQPCNYMKVSVGALQQPYYPNYILLELAYMDESYQEFINAREFDIESFWAGVGGFVGMFLGYSLLQIPETLSQLWIWISLRLKSLDRLFCHK